MARGADLARTLGTSRGTITPWLNGCIPAPANIRAILDIPEIADRADILDVYVYAGILRLEERNRHRTYPLPKLLTDYTDSEIHAEVTRRIAPLKTAKPE